MKSVTGSSSTPSSLNAPVVPLYSMTSQEKMLYSDTKIPPDLVKYPDYECYVNLQAPLADGTDPFYTDFPSAIVRYNEVMGGFYHSEHYLSHIQTRLAGVSSATF